MTNMEQIAYIAARERERGTSYGHGVALRGADYAKLEDTPMPILRRCTRCGREYIPPVGKRGTPYKRNICPDCWGKPVLARNPRTKIYVRKCDGCGVDVHTTQAPRKWALYCPECREKRKKLSRQRI